MNDKTVNELIKASKRLIGLKQVKKAIIDSVGLRCVILADDTDKHIRDLILQLAKETRTEVINYPRKDELGAACGIDVSCAVVGILK
ncbi:MAG: ribosomal L7Ae/L30e/S12e/Gadd45 family protein [Clostridiales bacterium]|jgi:large subunit ribosomal protein L7A|nr:ribosomal L7Ae/L30e/S12e/Gadd45 family protein [Clostridiales bacterium]